LGREESSRPLLLAVVTLASTGSDLGRELSILYPLEIDAEPIIFRDATW